MPRQTTRLVRRSTVFAEGLGYIWLPNYIDGKFSF